MENREEKREVYSKLIDLVNTEGVLHFSLIDPDPLRQSPQKAARMAAYCEEAGSDAILAGGSTIVNQEFVSTTVNEIKKTVSIPVIIFPGGVTCFSPEADAMFFMSLLNSRDPHFIVGQQAMAAHAIKASGIEYMPVSYLIVEPGATAGWVGNARLLPRDNPELTASYALASEMMGFRMVYLEAGSGSQRIPLSHVSMTADKLSVPLIVGGGIRTEEDARSLVEAGADIVVMGGFIEKNVIQDRGAALGRVIRELKTTGAGRKKKFTRG